MTMGRALRDKGNVWEEDVGDVLEQRDAWKHDVGISFWNSGDAWKDDAGDVWERGGAWKG